MYAGLEGCKWTRRACPWLRWALGLQLCMLDWNDANGMAELVLLFD